MTHFLISGGRVESVGTFKAEFVFPLIDDDPEAAPGDLGSDHAALVATFDR